MSSIPAFNDTHLLPPYRGEEGDEREHGNLSPYLCTTLELCKVFGKTKERIEMLQGLILFRERLIKENIISGFQWLYGSFSEEIEILEKRSPNDIDLITFFWNISHDDLMNLTESFPEFFNIEKSKKIFNLDHLNLDIGRSPAFSMNAISDMMQLCTHSRYGIWKGILRLELNTPNEDKMAWKYLSSLKL